MNDNSNNVHYIENIFAVMKILGSIENPMPHCAIVLVLDTSQRMWGPGLANLTASLNAFYDTLRNERFSNAQIDIAAVSMGNRLGMLKTFSPLELSWSNEQGIRPKCDTPIGAALSLALDKIDAQLESYHKKGSRYVTPQLIILSDGDSSDDFSAVAARIRQRIAAGKLVCWAITTGDNPNLATLCSITRMRKNVFFAQQIGMVAAFEDVGKIISQTYADEAKAIVEETFAATSSASGTPADGPILIDGTNILHWDKKNNRVTLNHLFAITDYFEMSGVDFKVFFDASTWHLLCSEERKRYENLLENRPGQYVQVPATTPTGDILLVLADGNPAIRIISNDVYCDYLE